MRGCISVSGRGSWMPFRLVLSSPFQRSMDAPHLSFLKAARSSWRKLCVLPAQARHIHKDWRTRLRIDADILLGDDKDRSGYNETRMDLPRSHCIQVDAISRERRPYINSPGYSYSGFARGKCFARRWFIDAASLFFRIFHRQDSQRHYRQAQGVRPYLIDLGHNWHSCLPIHFGIRLAKWMGHGACI